MPKLCPTKISHTHFMYTTLVSSPSAAERSFYYTVQYIDTVENFYLYTCRFFCYHISPIEIGFVTFLFIYLRILLLSRFSCKNGHQYLWLLLLSNFSYINRPEKQSPHQPIYICGEQILYMLLTWMLDLARKVDRYTK